MNRAYLYARRTGTSGTAVYETTRKNAVSIIRRNRKAGYQLGILGGSNLEVVRRVYGEFAPFKRVESEEELLNSVQ